MMHASNWSPVWPKAEGFYWLYGYPFGRGRGRDDSPMLAVCQVRHIGPEDARSPIYSVHGAMAWETSAGPTLFSPVAPPTLPELPPG